MTSVAESRAPVGDRICCDRPPARVDLILGPGRDAEGFHVVVDPAEIARFGAEAEAEGAASLRPSGRLQLAGHEAVDQVLAVHGLLLSLDWDVSVGRPTLPIYQRERHARGDIFFTQAYTHRG